MHLSDIVHEAHETAKIKGWWDEGRPREVGTLIALCHSELSEALECYREGQFPGYTLDIGHDNKPEGFAAELADVIIRIADMAGYYGIDLDQVTHDKLMYNQRRSQHHGGKQA